MTSQIDAIRTAILEGAPGEDLANLPLPEATRAAVVLAEEKTMFEGIASEDKDFFDHGGVSLTGLLRGIFRTYVKRDRTVGGSTVVNNGICLRLAREGETHPFRVCFPKAAAAHHIGEQEGDDRHGCKSIAAT